MVDNKNYMVLLKLTSNS